MRAIGLIVSILCFLAAGAIVETGLILIPFSMLMGGGFALSVFYTQAWPARK